jgi:hypothetical protein
MKSGSIYRLICMRMKLKTLNTNLLLFRCLCTIFRELMYCVAKVINYYNYIKECSRDSAVGIATRYGLDGPGIQSRWGRDFPHLS